MKTTEIFVEQVLIGLLVLATGYLPYCNTGKIKELFESKSIVEGAGIVAIAYLLGIVFDRFADTLLSRLEQYHRLKYTINLIENGKQHRNHDPYPEDKFQNKILKDNNGTTEKMNYFRSRIRLSRALSIFTPALTISGLLSLLRDSGQDKDTILVFLVSTAVIYLLCFIIVAFVLKIFPKTEDIDIAKVKNVKGYYKYKFIYVDNFPISRKTEHSKTKHSKTKFSWWSEPTTIAAGVLFGMMTFITVYYHPKHACVVLLIGLGISAISAWSWWRISETFMKFLMDCCNGDRENPRVNDNVASDKK